MTLEQLMAFTVNPDHGRQVQIWDAVKNSWNKEPYIRRMLTETSVRASDRRAIFVGVDAYEAAGGVVLRDLSSRAMTAAGSRTLPSSTGWSPRSFRLRPKRSFPKAGSGSRSRPTCPMATATVCGVWPVIPHRWPTRKARPTLRSSTSIGTGRGILRSGRIPRGDRCAARSAWKWRWKRSSSGR